MTWAELSKWVSSVLTTVWEWLSSGKFWIGLLIPTVVIALARLRGYSSHSVSIGLPFGLGSRTYDTTPTDRIVAWKLYIQLTTRKAALPFDEDYDLISEVYDSLFELFTVTRDLLLNLPPREFAREEGVASLLLRVQNDGLRPHLTHWQANFRRWWDRALSLEENKERSPQDIQRDYPRYTELVDDLKRTNTELSKFADELLVIARAVKRKPITKKAVPVPPVPEHPPDEATA